MPRRKQDSIHVPVDRAEAEQMIGEYTELERTRLLEELAASEAIDAIKLAHAKRRREIEAEAVPLFEGLKAWWEAGGKALAEKRRSATLGTATIGIRTTPPSVKLERGMKIGDVLAWLRSMKWLRANDFIRTKESLDKEALIKAIREEPELAEWFKEKLAVVQKDEFFIDTGLDAASLRKETADSG